MTSQIKLSSGFSSRTYAYALTKVFDSGFMGSVAIDFEKVRRSKTKKKDKKGEVRNHSIAFRVATDAIEYFFIDLMFQECEFYKYQPYDADWLIDDVLEAVSPFISDRQMTKVFDVICEPYFSAIRSLSADEHFSEKNMALACETCCRLVRAIYSNRKYRLIKEAYANEIADRILHDRQIASVISDYVSRYAKLKNGQPSPVARLRWPSNVKRILFARDRGKCAVCQCDIGIELLADAHIDHIIPRVRGGSNDLVNLQLLCRPCNLKKGARIKRVESSVPRYHSLHGKGSRTR